jgi:hypothetical protein
MVGLGWLVESFGCFMESLIIWGWNRTFHLVNRMLIFNEL